MGSSGHSFRSPSSMMSSVEGSTRLAIGVEWIGCRRHQIFFDADGAVWRWVPAGWLRIQIHLRFAEIRRLDKGEYNDLLTGDGTDVVVQAQDLDASDLLDHRLHDWPGHFEQVGPRLLEQIPPLLGRKRFDQLPFGRSQDASKANQ